MSDWSKVPRGRPSNASNHAERNKGDCWAVFVIGAVFCEFSPRPSRIQLYEWRLRKLKDDWISVDAFELRAFSGLLLLAGVHRSKGEDILALWSEKCTPWGPPFLAATMNVQCFMHSTRCLSFDDRHRRRELRANTNNSANATDGNKLAPIRTAFDAWVAMLKVMYVPGLFVTVYEQIVGGYVWAFVGYICREFLYHLYQNISPLERRRNINVVFFCRSLERFLGLIHVFDVYYQSR